LASQLQYFCISYVGRHAQRTRSVHGAQIDINGVLKRS